MIKMSDLYEHCDYVFSSYAEMPEYFRGAKYTDDDGEKGERFDLGPLMKNGKEWAYEFMLQTQPRTAAQLLSGGDFKYVAKFASFGYVTHVVQEINGQIVDVWRQFKGDNPDDSDYRATIDAINQKLTKKKGYPYQTTERQFSLPEPIRLAYYHRIDGLKIPDSPAFGISGRILPFAAGCEWDTIDSVLLNQRLRNKLLPTVEEMIPGVRPDKPGSPYINFMMFLSSYGSFTGKKKTDDDQLFVKNHIQDGVVYYIRDHDVANMMILADPVEAIDRYCEHILMRKEERFDFRPWAIPFESPAT